MIAEIDKDGSGQLEFDEFFDMMTTRPSENESRDEIRKVFVTFDTDRSGYISLKHLRKVAKELGELQDDHVLQEMIDRADFDQDGLVSEE
jgi:centrin-1